MTAQTVERGTIVSVQSSESGFAYLVPTGVDSSTIDSVVKVDGLLNGSTYMKAYIAAGNTPSDMAAPTKVGTYKLIVVDEAGNVSTLADSDTITVEDTTKPSYVAAGTVYFNIIDMTFDEELDGNHADPTAFVVHVGAGTIPVQRVEVEGTQLKIYLVSNIPWATAISIDYTASGSNDLVDPYGNKVSNFAGKPIGNNVE